MFSPTGGAVTVEIGGSGGGHSGGASGENGRDTCGIGKNGGRIGGSGGENGGDGSGNNCDGDKSGSGEIGGKKNAAEITAAAAKMAAA